MKRVGPKRVSLFEAGAGDKPIGILNQALRAEQKRRGRSFIASDIALRKEATLREKGIGNKPKNLRMLRNCSVKELRKLPAQSQDIVFESFFLNNYGFRGKTGAFSEKKILTYFKEAKRVLKPNGRIVLTQILFRTKRYSQLAKKMGLRASVIRLTPKQMENSPSFWIRKRGTQRKREDMFIMERESDHSFALELLKYAKKNKLAQVSDVFTPCFIVLRK